MSNGHEWNYKTLSGGRVATGWIGEPPMMQRVWSAFSPGCWITRNGDGSFSVLRDEDFRRIYEEVESDG